MVTIFDLGRHNFLQASPTCFLFFFSNFYSSSFFFCLLHVSFVLCSAILSLWARIFRLDKVHVYGIVNFLLPLVFHFYWNFLLFARTLCGSRQFSLLQSSDKKKKPSYSENTRLAHFLRTKRQLLSHPRPSLCNRIFGYLYFKFFHLTNFGELVVFHFCWCWFRWMFYFS